MYMSTNTKKDIPPREEDSLSFLKYKWKIYLFIFLGVYIAGRLISRGERQELFTQGARNFISLVALSVVFIAGLANAELAYLALVLYVPFVDVLPGRFGGEYTALNLFNVLSTVAILCWFVDKVKKERPFFIKNRATKLAIIFVVLSGLSYVVNGFEYGTNYLINQVFNLKRWFDPILIFFIASGMTYRRDLRKDTIVAMLLGIAMVIFLSVKDVGQITHFSETRRVAGVGEQPNMLGAFVVDYVFLFMGIMFVKLRRFIYWVAVLPFIWGIKAVLFSFSRGAYIAFVTATLVFSFIRSKFLFIAVIGILLFVATNRWVLPQAVRERIDMTVTGEELYSYQAEFEPSAERRVEAWKSAFYLIKNKPLLGYGIGMVGTYLFYYAGIGMGDVHNSFILLAAEFGVVTLLVFLLCILMGFRISWFIYRHSKDDILKGTALGFMAGLSGLLVNCMFGSHMTTLWEIGYFWALLAVLANEEKELKDELSAATLPKT